MKNVVILLFFLFALNISGQPVFYVEKPTFHFDYVLQKSEVEGEFLIENRGNEPLEFKEVIPYCNCTILSMPEKLLPGAKEKIIFTITPKIAEGDWNTVIKITTNEPGDNIHKLKITMNVIPLLKFDPSQDEAITLLPDENLEINIKIFSPAKIDFSILEFSTRQEEMAKMEQITPFGKKIKPGEFFEFKIKSSQPLKTGENFFNFRLKTDIENLPVIGHMLKIIVKDYIWAEPEEFSFNLNPKPGVITPSTKNKVAYFSPKKGEKILFKLNEKNHYKVVGSIQDWYQIQDPSSNLIGWVPWEGCIVIDNGFQASVKLFSAKNIPFKIKSIQCPEKYLCNYKEEKDHYILTVNRYAPILSLAENLEELEVLTDHPKKEKIIIPFSEKKIEKYWDTKEKMERKLKKNPKFQDNKLEDAKPKITIERK